MVPQGCDTMLEITTYFSVKQWMSSELGNLRCRVEGCSIVVYVKLLGNRGSQVTQSPNRARAREQHLVQTKDRVTRWKLDTLNCNSTNSIQVLTKLTLGGLG